MKQFLILLLALCAAVPVRAEESVSDRLLREHLWSEVANMPPGERPKVGLVLSAGSVRGIAHVGVIRALETAGFPVDIVTGTSMGAIVGSLYAGGIPADKLWKLGQSSSITEGTDFSRFRLLQLILYDRLLSSKKIEAFLKENLGDRYFDQLGKPFACVALDLKTGEPIIFREGPVALAVRASMNLPGIFEPVEYRHRYLVDGAVADYIPIDAAKLLGAEWILASVTQGDYTRTQPTNVLSTLEQAFDIRGSLLANEQAKQANFVVRPPVQEITLYQVARGPEAMEKGLIEMTHRIPDAEDSLILYTLPRLMRRWRTR